jgi:hypothetical protein
MKRILLTLAVLGALVLPAAALARVDGRAKPGFLVVRQARGDGGVNGHAVVTVVVHGFVMGRVSQEARVDIYQAPSPGSQGPQAAAGPAGDVSKRAVKWRTFAGTEFSGSGFRFYAPAGYYRVVVRGSGIYLFTGGHGNVTLHGSSFAPRADGTFSVDGRAFRSLPTRILNRKIGRG